MNSNNEKDIEKSEEEQSEKPADTYVDQWAADIFYENNGREIGDL